MKKLHVCLLLLAITQCILAQTIQSKYENQKRVIQSNHFRSTTDNRVSYQLQNIELGQPLILILKKSDTNQDINKNRITAKFNGSKTNLECSFTSFHSLCVIPEVEDQNIKMDLECKQKPCEISWVLYQPQIRQAKNNNKSQPYGLFTLQQSNNHLVVHITCSDPEIKTLQEDVQVYSQSHYERGGSKSQVYILFTNEQKGFIYIDIEEGSSRCAQLNFENVPQKLGYDGQTILDFTLKGSSSNIKLDLPKNNINIDCFLQKLHSVNQKQQKTMSPITFRLLGQPNKSNKQLISQILVTPYPHKNDQSINLIFKKPSKSYEELTLQAVSNQQSMTIIDFTVVDQEVHQIALNQQSYFYLQKDQTIKYKFQKLNQAEQGNIIIFSLSDSKKLSVDKTECKAAQGCQFLLTALEDVNGTLKAENKEQIKQEKTTKQEEIYFINIGSTYKTKVKIDQKIYLKKSIKKNKVFRININTPNALIYVSSSKSCSVPSQDCSDQIGNIHHPIINNPTEDGIMLITILPLQNSEIVITILQEKDQYITLEDGVAFGYTLYQKEQRLEFKYTLAEKKDVNFNLVAPLNNLLLIVQNQKESNNYISTEGFITISKNQLKGLEFTIIVQKTTITKNKQTHFTLFASTQDTVIRLQPTVAHYETIKQQTYRQYIFQYSPSQSYTINFYIHNVKQQKIKVMLALSTDRKWTNQKLDKIWIDRESDFIDLGQLSGKLCSSQGAQSCEVFLRLENQMPIQVDITITLMVRNSIIELKDGIWQSYSENTLISSAHFYFYPKHKDKNLVLLYHSSISNLRLSYNLWKTDEKSISPLFWPFPAHKNEFQSKITKISNQVTIDKQIMKEKCWPSCVLLITLFRDSKLNSTLNGVLKDFKIMASNYQIQIPEKTRIDITMKTSQQKEIILDLKYALSKQSLTIYNTRFFGQYVIFANLYSQKRNRCPLDGQQVSDYLLKSGENLFSVQDLQKKIKTLGMQNDSNIYMCLSIKSEYNCKFAIQYTADEQNIKAIHMDTFEQIKLNANSTKYYQFEGYMDFDAKIMRKQGFPFLYIINCSLAKIVECKQQLFQNKDKGKQIISKAQDFSQLPCNQCIYLFKFQTLEPSLVVFHLKSKFSMNQLRQHEIITDFIKGQYQNNYFLTHLTGKPLVIDIHVLEGELQAILTNNRNVNLIKSSNKQKLIHFYVKPQKSGDQNAANETQLGKSIVNPFQFSTTFSNYHLLLTNKQQNKTCSYSITYSSGESKVYLQDGLITDVTLQPKRPFTFDYYRESQSHIYLTISSLQPSNLFNLSIQSFYYQLEDAQVKTSFNLQKPNMNIRKNPNPTLLFLLPPKKHFEIVLQNPTQKSFAISIGINHQQLIFLPFNHDYPFSLHQGQELNFLSKVNQPGYIEITVRKCDKSEPILSYVSSYKSFINKQFDNWIVLKDQPLFRQVIKVQKAGTFYVNLKTAQNQKSRLSVNVTFYKNKVQKRQLRAGAKGIIEYQIINNFKVNISFLPINCKNTKCSKVRYFAEVSLNLDDLYLQMVCPSSYFSLIQYNQVRSISQKQIEIQSNQDIITTSLDLIDHISYVGIKAITQNNQQIYYKPIEVVTLWGQLERTSKTHKITLAIIIIISLCGLLFFVRYNARKGYKRIEGTQTQ